MAGNKNLQDSAKNRQDEFYTQLSLIENELRHYKEHFKGKTVFCNCDDPFESEFFKYFAMNFNRLGLRKLIATCYVSSPIVGKELELYVEPNGKMSFLPQPNSILSDRNKHPYKVEITSVTDENRDGRTDMADVEWLLRNKKNTITLLSGNGDFRSKECVDLLKESDIVVTNPPFSLFREYVAQLIKYNKHFLIIGNLNAVTYKEILPLIMNNEMWLGYNSGHFWFKVPDAYESKRTDFKIDDRGQKWRRMGNICWFTNLDIQKRHETFPLFRKYNEHDYPVYDHYDAIDVSQIVNIPCDYYGVMGVPITFMTKYNPDQFEIIGLDRYTVPKQYLVGGRVAVNGKPKYARMLIRRKVNDNENQAS